MENGNATKEESMSQLSPTERSWARGLTVFAATIMIIAGVFQALQGLVALANSEFYVVGSEYTFEFDITCGNGFSETVNLADTASFQAGTIPVGTEISSVVSM